MKYLRTGLFILTAACAAQAWCAPVGEEAQVAACIEEAARVFKIDPLPLALLRQVEAGAVGMTSGNSNGSYDIGPMQINSTWLPRLARIGITEPMLRDDACVNVYVAAWIFTQEFKATGDIVSAMARYHSPTPIHQQRWV